MNTFKLPEDYEQVFEVDIKRNKKLAIMLNVAALLIALAMLVPVLFLVPFNLYESDNIGMLFIKPASLIVSLILYVVLHELVHGIFIHIFSGQRAKYGISLTYVCAGSNAYFDKKCYIIIALAPIVIWGIVFAVLTASLPVSWFWVIYLLQIVNISGAAGDIYVTAHMLRLPADTLTRDTGATMKMYSKMKENNKQ